MYEYLKGEVESLELNNVVIECNNIGYIANISLQSYSKLSDIQEGEQTKLYLHQYQVRDNLPVLFGFCTVSERALFRMLIDVSGVGGGTACNILSTFTPEELQTIISTGDHRMLKSVKGLGQKTAEKIVVELRDKVINVDIKPTEGAPSTTGKVKDAIYEEALQGLMSLGFTKSASTKALDKVILEMPKAKLEDIVRIALKSM